MKRTITLVVLPLILCTQSNALNLLTYNIRRAGKKKHTYRCWSHRKKQLAQQINHCNADIIGLQEVTPQQLHYLQQHLNPCYTATGTTGRGDSWGNRAANEANPIFYNSSRFTALKKGHVSP